MPNSPSTVPAYTATETTASGEPLVVTVAVTRAAPAAIEKTNEA
jgi:hypothetical protein